jgi:hypothetical protein
MRHGIFPKVLPVLLAAASAACSVAGREATPRPPNPAAMSFFNEGKQLCFGVDVRPSRIAGTGEALTAFQIVVVNKDLDLLEIDRESILIEGANGKVLPLASYEEFRKEYGRTAVDERAGQPFRDTMTGRFPSPPYELHELDFYPPRGTVRSPRESIDLRRGDMAMGFVYFRLGELAPAPPLGRYKLLLRPKGMDTFVLEFPAHG